MAGKQHGSAWSLATVVAFSALALSACAVTALPGAATQLTRARIAVRRLRELTEPDPSRRERPAVTPVDVQPGDRLAVVGPSGCGKTSLLMAVAATHENPLTAGYFAEDAHLFDTTVRDNLLVARGDATDAELTAALARAGLSRWLGGLPEGLSTVLTGGAAAVTGGAGSTASRRTSTSCFTRRQIPSSRSSSSTWSARPRADRSARRWST